MNPEHATRKYIRYEEYDRKVAEKGIVSASSQSNFLFG